MGLYFRVELFSRTHGAREAKSTSSYTVRSYTRNVKFIRMYTKMGLFIVAIGIPCIMDVWERHREPSQTEQCSELLDRARELAVCVEI